jgi:hypothetical protein
MFHGTDERIPVAGLAWGVEVLDAVVREVAVEVAASARSSAAARG